MKISSSTYSINYEQLTNLFSKKSEGLFVLEPEIGNGSVQIFHLSRGLEARFWNCTFNHELELYGHESPEVRNRHFTLVCFLNTAGLQIYSSDASLQENFLWNTMFISAKSHYRMTISPKAEGKCLSISFAKTWLDQNILEPNDSFKHLKQEVRSIDTFSLLGTMNATQKNIVAELLDFSWKKSLGTFYIKSSVLKIISDFLYKIKEREAPSINHHCVEQQIPEIKKYIE